MSLPEGVTLQWEPLASISRDLLPLFHKHWQEVEDYKDLLPVDPAWDLLFKYDLLGLLRVLTVRCDGLLVGYLFLMFPPSLHYSRQMAFIERFWLEPAHRRGFTGIRLFKEAETLARAAKAVMLTASPRINFAKDRGGIGVILERLGYKPLEITYAKVL